MSKPRKQSARPRRHRSEELRLLLRGISLMRRCIRIAKLKRENYSATFDEFARAAWTWCSGPRSRGSGGRTARPGSLRNEAARQGAIVNQNKVAPCVRSAKRPRTVLPARGLAALRRKVDRYRLDGTLCTNEEWEQWRQHFTNDDPQQDAAYAWESMSVGEILDGRDAWLDEAGARSLLESLRARHLSHWGSLPLRVLEQDDDKRKHVDPAGAFRIGEDMAPYIALWKLGDWAEWADVTVVHEFAHAMVYGTYGTRHQGVEGHGAEFVGVLCYLLADHYGIDVADLLLSAIEAGLRVLPFDPR